MSEPRKTIWLIFDVFFSNLTDEEKLMHFNGIFDHPLVHLGPYLVGILFGFFAHNYEKKVRIHSALVYIGWITSVVLFALLMLSSYKIDNVDPWLKQSFATISHTFWSLVLLWICFASMAGCGGKLIGATQSINTSHQTVSERQPFNVEWK